MSLNSKSTVISFKLLPSEIYLWKKYSLNIGISPSKFLISKVDRYLFLQPLKELYDSERAIKAVKKSRKFKQLLKNEENLSKNLNNLESSQLTNVSLRLKKSTLKKWDEYRKARFFSRTALIRQTLDRFFNTKPKNLIKFEVNKEQRLSSIVKALICEVGSIDFRRLDNIFENKVDSSVLMGILNKLEEEGVITGKGQWDNYVPTTPPESGSNTLMLGELLMRFI